MCGKFCLMVKVKQLHVIETEYLSSKNHNILAYIHHSQVLNIIKDVSQAITSWTESLQRSVDFHTNSFVKKDREHICKKTGSKYDDLFTAVHSLDLHLQSALTR